MSNNPGKNVSRRNFIKTSAVTVAATGTSALAGSATMLPAAENPAAKAAAGASPSDRVPGYCGEGDWLGTAPVISDANITKTIDVDVLVLGGGHAGLMAAIGASDLGAKVAVVEKQAERAFEGYNGRVGEDIGHVNSKWLINRGFGPYDTGEITQEFVRRANGRCNPDIIRLYVENSGAMFDRMVEVYEEYQNLRKANDSKVEFRYSDGSRGRGTGGAPGGASGAGGASGRAGGPPAGAAGAPGGGMPGGAGGAREGGMPPGGMPATAAGGETITYDFSNVLSPELCISQTQKGVKPNDYPVVLGGFKTWPCNAQFMGPAVHKPVGPFISVLRWFEKYHVKKTIDQGADWYYETTAVVLTQEANGDVAGAIVQDGAGKYIKFRAKNGVILATGGFQSNGEMCWALLNEDQEWAERGGLKREGLRSTAFSGQGHKMGCWAGGMIEPSPRCGMGFGGGTDGPWGRGPMLQLNANAKRFCNESAVPLIGDAVKRQPKGAMCLVTDKKFMKSVEVAGLEHGGPNYGRPVYYEETEADMKEVLGTGAQGFAVRGCTVAERSTVTVYGANTLEELAGYLGYTGDLVKTFVESIQRYNKFCEAGVDSDFGKDAKALIPVDEPPFYGCKGQNGGGGGGMMGLGGMATLSGLMCDEKLRVLNEGFEPIKGLFAAGNALGGKYGPQYATPFSGNSIGMALTHGWLAGKYAVTL